MWCQHTPQTHERRQGWWQLNSIRVKSGSTERGVHRKQREKSSQNSLATVSTWTVGTGRYDLAMVSHDHSSALKGLLSEPALPKNSTSKWSPYLWQHRLHSPVIWGTTNSSYCCCCKTTELLDLLSPQPRLLCPHASTPCLYHHVLYHQPSFKIFMLWNPWQI